VRAHASVFQASAACVVSSFAIRFMCARTCGSRASRACHVATSAPYVSRTHPSMAFSIAKSSSDRSPRTSAANPAGFAPNLFARRALRGLYESSRSPESRQLARHPAERGDGSGFELREGGKVASEERVRGSLLAPQIRRAAPAGAIAHARDDDGRAAVRDRAGLDALAVRTDQLAYRAREVARFGAAVSARLAAFGDLGVVEHRVWERAVERDGERATRTKRAATAAAPARPTATAAAPATALAARPAVLALRRRPIAPELHATVP
jgi:hypothetical protein